MDFEYIRKGRLVFKRDADGLFRIHEPFQSVNQAKKHTSKIEKEKKGIVRRWNKEMESLIKA